MLLIFSFLFLFYWDIVLFQSSITALPIHDFYHTFQTNTIARRCSHALMHAVAELEELWKKLTFIEEEDEDIVLGSNSTRVAKEVGKNCIVMKVLTQ